jgi:uncharacterized protein (TIGR03000 family)
VTVTALFTCNAGALRAQEFYPPANMPIVPFGTYENPLTMNGPFTFGPGYMSFSQARANPYADEAAYIHMRVSPPNAEISFEGVKTMQVGSSRLFKTPPLQLDKNYTYTLRATWQINGKTVSQERVLPVRAGDWLSIVFLAPASAPGASVSHAAPGQ